MKLFIFSLSIILLFLSTKCNKRDNRDVYQVPHTLYILIKKNNQRLPDSILNNMRLGYFQNGVEEYVTDFTRAINEGGFNAYDSGIQVTRNIGLSSGDGIKNYYLEYPDGSKDTLFADYKHLSFDQAVNDPCFCLYPLQSVKFNGQVAITDPSITMAPVYLFNK